MSAARTLIRPRVLGATEISDPTTGKSNDLKGKPSLPPSRNRDAENTIIDDIQESHNNCCITRASSSTSDDDNILANYAERLTKLLDEFKCPICLDVSGKDGDDCLYKREREGGCLCCLYVHDDSFFSFFSPFLLYFCRCLTVQWRRPAGMSSVWSAL